MYYHLSWLEIAIENFKNDYTEVHSINGNMTLQEFIEKWASKELQKCINIQ